MKTSTFFILFICFLSLLTFSLQQRNGLEDKIPPVPNLEYLPNPKVVRYLAPGHQETFAGLLWIQSVSYFGDAVIQGKSDRWYADLLSLISTLDPQLQSPYTFASVLDRLKLEQVESLLTKGIHYYPLDWKLHLFYAFKLVNEGHDYKKAAQIMKTQATNDKAPAYIQNLWKRYANNSEDLNLQILLVVENYRSSKGAMQQENRDKLLELGKKQGFDQTQMEQILEDLKSENKLVYNSAIDRLTRFR